MSKLQDYLTKNKISLRRLTSASGQLERLTPEDRKIKQARMLAKGGNEAAKELAAKKPRSGRKLNPATVQRAMAGTAVSGPAKTRVLRAVNAVLAQRKKPEVKFSDLF
jgi:hypothetical protein